MFYRIFDNAKYDHFIRMKIIDIGYMDNEFYEFKIVSRV